MRIFLDIGGYHGHSALAALDPLFDFDRVFCFEPVPYLAERIRQIANSKLIVVEAALSDQDGTATLHHAGTLAGSMFADAPSYLSEGEAITIQTLSASAFLSTIINDETEFVRTKFNCEGAEIAIISDLLENAPIGFTRKVLERSLVDFDARKIPSLRARQTELETQLAEQEIAYFTPPECQYGMVTNYGGVRNYLILSGATRPGIINGVNSFVYNMKMARNSEINGYHKMRLLSTFPALRAFARSQR